MDKYIGTLIKVGFKQDGTHTVVYHRYALKDGSFVDLSLMHEKVLVVEDGILRTRLFVWYRDKFLTGLEKPHTAEQKLFVICHGVHVSDGNSKMGKHMLYWSMPAGPKSCGGTCADCVADTCYPLCYGAASEDMYILAKTNYRENFELFLSSPDEFFAGLDGLATYIENHPSWPQCVRGHENGDFPSIPYVERCFDLAEKHPSIRFLFFTKRYLFVNKVLEHRTVPENMVIQFSDWEGIDMSNPNNLPVYGVVMPGTQGTENLPKDSNGKAMPTMWCVGTGCGGDRAVNEHGENWTCRDCFEHKIGCYWAKNGTYRAVNLH